MKLPEDEQKAYEHYQDDLHYQASLFESSFGDGYYEGKSAGIEQTTIAIALKEYRKRNASVAEYDDPRVAVGPGGLSES